jgi:CRP-like cAMP-binding protein
MIFDVGDPGDVMYGVKEGEVEIFVGDRVLETIGPGSLFGEMSLIEGSIRSASARAKTDCQIVPINERRFTFLVQQTPFFALQVMRIMAERLRRATPN